MNPQLTPDIVRAIVREELRVKITDGWLSALAETVLDPKTVPTLGRNASGELVALDDIPGGGEPGAQGHNLGLQADDDTTGLFDVAPDELRQQCDAITEVITRLGSELRDGLEDALHVGRVVLADGKVRGGGHNDSSSVVPDVAPSGDDATVEVTGDAARVDSSPRRVAGTHVPIQPPYTLYTLTVEQTFDLIAVVERELDGTLIRSQGLHPSQARGLAAWLIEAADRDEAVTR